MTKFKESEYNKLDFKNSYDYDNTLQKACYKLNHPLRRRKLFN